MFSVVALRCHLLTRLMHDIGLSRSRGNNRYESPPEARKAAKGRFAGKSGVNYVVPSFRYFSTCLPAIAWPAVWDWVMPVDYFDGVNDFGGYVDYWESVGEVDCGEWPQAADIHQFQVE